MSEPARDVCPHVKLTREQVLAFIENPLKQLPEDWRLPVWDFWAFFENLLPTQIALCTRIRRWRDREGLTIQELEAAMDELREPEVVATIQFAGQVLAGLADRIETNRKARREEQRKAREKERASASVPDAGFVTQLAAHFRDPSIPPVRAR